MSDLRRGCCHVACVTSADDDVGGATCGALGQSKVTFTAVRNKAYLITARSFLCNCAQCPIDLANGIACLGASRTVDGSGAYVETCDPAAAPTQISITQA